MSEHTKNMEYCYWCLGSGIVLPEQGVTAGGQVCKYCSTGELHQKLAIDQATAHELLEALETIMSNQTGLQENIDAERKARAAIAKAKGITDAPS